MVKMVSQKELNSGHTGFPRAVAEESDLEKICELAKQGKSLKIIAARIGVSNGQLEIWLGTRTEYIHLADPRVRAAWEAGLAEYEDSLSSVLHRNAFNDDSRMQVASAMFLLKAKCKWRDNDPVVQIDVKQKAPNKFKVKNITPSDSE